MAKMTDEEIAAGLEENKKIFYEYPNMEYAKLLIDNVLNVPIDMYFRTKMVGFEESEERNRPEHPVILVSNHSGMAFPWDGICLVATELRKMNYQLEKAPRALIAPQLTRIALMSPFLQTRLWEHCGGVDATFFNFETMMHYPHANLLVFPEGTKGIGKGFDKRYQLQRLATSFVRMAIKYKTDIVPILTINGEYVNPYAYSSSWLNALTSKIGIPYLPIGLTSLLLPFCPWMFYFALPARLTFVKCQRIRIADLVEKDYENLSENEIKAIRDKVAEQMQMDLNQAVKQHGRQPFQWKSFLQSCRKNRKHLLFMFPFGWPLLFSEFGRQWKRYQKTGQKVDININFWSPILFLIRNPFSIFFYLPILGWLPILIKGYKRVK